MTFHLLHCYYLPGIDPILFCCIQTVGDGDCVWAGGAAGDIDVSSDEYFDIQSTLRGEGLPHPADLSSSPSVSIEIKKRVMRIFDSSIALCSVSLLPLLLHPGTVTERWFELSNPAGGTRCGMLLLRLLLVLHDDIPQASAPYPAPVPESASPVTSYGGLLMSHGPVSDFQDIDLSTPRKHTSGISSGSSSSRMRDNNSSSSSGFSGTSSHENSGKSNSRSNDDFIISSNLTPSKTSETTPNGRKSPVPVLIPSQPQATTMSLIRPDPFTPTPLRRRGPLSSSPTTPVTSTASLPLSPSATSTVTSTSMTSLQSAISATAATPSPASFQVENNQGSAGMSTSQSDARKNLERVALERTPPELYNSTVPHTMRTDNERSQGAARGALDSLSSPSKGLIVQGERALYGSPDYVTLRQRRGGAVSTEKNFRRSSRSVSPSSDSDSRGSKKKSRIKGKGKGGVVKGKGPSKALIKGGKTGPGLKDNEGDSQGSLLAPVTPAGMAHWFVNISSTALGYLEKQLMDTEENSNGDVRDEGAMIADAHSTTGKAQFHGQGQDIRGEKVRGSDKMEGVGRIHVSLVSVFKTLVTDAAEGDHYVVRSVQMSGEK
jgi:hypothetical protein